MTHCPNGSNVVASPRVYLIVNGEAIEMPAGPVAGEAEADASARLGELFEQHHQRLYRLARRMVSNADDARDLVQETFLRVARKPSGLPDDLRTAEAWLVRVLVNICHDDWRKRGVRRRFTENEGQARPAPADPEAPLVAHATVWVALRGLTPRRRAAIVMYELEGASMADIARALGVSPITVRWHLSRGRKELAQIIGRARES